VEYLVGLEEGAFFHEIFVPIIAMYSFTRWTSRSKIMSWREEYRLATLVALRRIGDLEVPMDKKTGRSIKLHQVADELMDPLINWKIEYQTYFMKNTWLVELDWARKENGFLAAEMKEHVEALKKKFEHARDNPIGN
jgi:hypothetical protein